MPPEEGGSAESGGDERTKVRWLRFRAGGGAGLSLPYIRTINEAFSRP